MGTCRGLELMGMHHSAQVSEGKGKSEQCQRCLQRARMSRFVLEHHRGHREHQGCPQSLMVLLCWKCWKEHSALPRSRDLGTSLEQAGSLG